LEILEFFLNILKTIVHIVDIATDLALSHRKILHAILGFIFAGCLIYFWKIDSISNATLFPLALFFTTGIYLSYILFSWIILKFNA